MEVAFFRSSAVKSEIRNICLILLIVVMWGSLFLSCSGTRRYEYDPAKDDSTQEESESPASQDQPPVRKRYYYDPT